MVKKIPLKVLNLFQQLHELFGTPHCPKCKGLQERYELCPSCCQTLGFKPECIHIQPGNHPVWELFTWNRRIQRIWYGVKFYKRYGHLFLIEIAFQQALAIMPPFEEGHPIWVLHPPFQVGRANVFAPFLEPLCQKQGWRYFADALEFQDAFLNSPDERKSLHHSQSISERKQLMQNRFRLKASFVEALKRQSIQPVLIVVDDFMTTGTTLATCLSLLENALSNREQGKDANHAICDKIESTQALLHAIVITTVPKTSSP
jgi:predicted amidophosphoribosyltransferase